jgi:hypothetical protein
MNFLPATRTALKLLLGFILLVVMCLLGSRVLFAQTVSIPLSWTPPTAHVDGSPITGRLNYNLYQGPSLTGPFAHVVGDQQLSATTILVTSLAGGPCFMLTALETLGNSITESAPSNVLCIGVPNPPSNVVAK